MTESVEKQAGFRVRDSEKTFNFEFAKMLSEVRNNLQSCVESIDAYINLLSKAELREWDASKIRWVEAEGQHGKYEKSDDVNNAEFKALLKDLADHDGKLSFKGLFYWVFQNGTTIGRKKVTH